ncbi:glycosylated lysosomal membrane protein A-like [Neocloeon triangulifer]|uniref:glycosylated lysosomal membrane protein A-like n=1 Tax=Neocloeon triangulifer TaxID=2078957 RepID=UPI00286ECB53|nr:glycosylated lysosomal membrane protein A-like [Neocloeon triangulifer]
MLCFVFIALLSISVSGQTDPERQVHWVSNPGCPKDSPRWDCNQTQILHVVSQGPNDTINYLWAFYSKPSLLISVTDSDAELKIDWANLGLTKNRTIRFDPKPDYSFGLALDKVIEFYDASDSANMSLANDSIARETENFTWSVQKINLEGGDLQVELLGSQYNNGSLKGNITMMLSVFGKDGYGPLLPHIQHSSNASQVEITLENFETSKKFKGKSRFGLQFMLVDSLAGEGPDQVEEKRSLDDEHTPGVFTIDELLTPTVRNGGLGGYLEWRPVAYTSSARAIEESTTTVHYPMRNVSQAHLKGSLLHDFFGHSLAHTLVPQALNISFGVSEDGFYRATNHNAWTFTMGYGQPPKEKFSLLVILILAIGLGVPATLFVFGGIFMACKKCRARKEEPLLN